MSTIAGTINHGITLGTSGAYSSPLIITTIGSASNNGTGDAIYGPAASAALAAMGGRNHYRHARHCNFGSAGGNAARITVPAVEDRGDVDVEDVAILV